MPLSIRTATLKDVDAIVTLMAEDARQRSAANPVLWKLKADPEAAIRASITSAMKTDSPPFRQQWLVATVDGEVVGVTHSILLPVPPIYAGDFGPPGLIMEDCFVAPHAPSETALALLQAAEVDLIEAGAQILLASSVEGGAWAEEYARSGYQPKTIYLAKSVLRDEPLSGNTQKATDADVEGIVESSATNRRILESLHPTFWKPHADADNRFGSWMKRSLALKDRDMFVSGDEHDIQGYAISQPATPLHFPAPHDISGIGVIDDFYHDALQDPAALAEDSLSALALFYAAEAARAQRGDRSVLVVCPVAWQSKIDLLQQADYHSAITWFIKIPANVGSRAPE